MFRGAALWAVLAVLASAGTAQARTSFPGDYGYGLRGCISSTGDYGGYGGSGKCDAQHPRVTISVAPAWPRTGAPVELRATARGVAGGLTYTWDLDGDGAYDDTPAGAPDPSIITHAFGGAGTVEIGVRVVNDQGQVATEHRTVTVHTENLAPATEVTAYPNAPRVGQSVTLSRYADDRDGTIASTAWDLDGNGTFETPGTGSSVPTTFSAAGHRTVGVRVTDDGGATATATLTLEVHEDNLEPYVSLSAYPQVVRPGKPVSLYVSASDLDGSIASYAFDLDGDGTYETAASNGYGTSTSFPADGTYVVGVRVTDNDGAVSISRRSIQVSSANVAPSLSLYQSAAGPTSVTFTAYGSDYDSGYNTLQYAWDLNGDDVYDDLVGTNATVATLPIPGVGSYEIGVRVTDADGAITTRRTVVVRRSGAPPAVQISNYPSQPRVGQQFSVSGYSSAAGDAQYAWDTDDDGSFDDGTSTGVSVTYATAGPHSVAVRLTSPSGQSTISRAVVTVSPATGDLLPAPNISLYPSQPRAGASVSLSVYGTSFPSSFASVAWDLNGDGQFDDSTESFLSKTYAAAGTYEAAVRVTDALGGTAVQRRTIVVHDGNLPPTVAISAPDTGVAGQTISVYANADGQDDGIATFAWDLDGDGQFDDSTVSNPTTTLASAGTLRIRVRVTDTTGASTDAVRPIVVTAPQPNHAPRIEFNPTNSVRPNVGTGIYAYASDPDGDPLTYAWDVDNDGQFNDGTSSSVIASFPSPGTPTVRVRVSDGRGGVSIGEATIQVRAMNLPPQFSYYSLAPAAPRVGRPMTLYSYAYDPDGQSVTMTYDLDGDGEFDDAPGGPQYSPTWTPTSTAPVTIGFRATDAEGASTTRTVQVTPRAANLPPVVWLANRPVPKAGTTMALRAYAQDPDGGAPTVAWDLDGDGQFDDAAGVNASLLIPATPLTIAVRATDDEGETATTRQTFTPGGTPPAPTFTASTLTPKQNETVTFTSTATPGDSAISSRKWDLDGDGQFDDASGTVTTRAFALAGDALVGLEVTDADGDRGVSYQVVKVLSLTAPVATFTMTPDTPGTGQTVTFTSTSTDPQGAGDIASQQWDLDGDGAYDDATGPVATTSYPQAGRYRVRLKVTDAAGESSTAIVFFRVAGNASPTAQFTRSPLTPVVGQQVTFASTSTDSDGTIVSQAWDLDNDGQFDDGTAVNATQTYATAGSKTVRLKVTDDKGATNVVAETFTVVTGAPTASFTTAPSPARAGAPVTFTSTSSDIDGSIVSQAWDLDDDGQYDDGTAITASRSFTLPGDYIVGLKVTDNDGKTDVLRKTVRIRANVPPVLSVLASKPTPRTGESVSFSASASDPDNAGAVTVTWDLDGDGQFDDGTGTGVSRSFPAAGTYTVSARAQDAENGVTVDSATVKVSADNQAPVLYAYSDDDAKRRGASGATFTLSAYAWDPDDSTYGVGGNSDGIATWSWDLNGDGDYTDPEDQTGASLKTLQVTLGAGLTGTITHTIHVRVTDTFNPSKSTEQTLSVKTYDGNNPPAASIYHYPWAVQRNVANTYVAQAADPDGDQIASYAWDLDGDGQFDDGTGSKVQWAFASRGTKTIKVRVRDDQQPAAETVASYDVEVTGALPVARWTATPFAPDDGEAVTLASTSTDPDGTIASTGWDLNGDGTYDDATGPSLTRTFPSGTTSVSLRVVDNDGNVAIRTGQIVVHAPIQKPGGGASGIGTPQPQPTTSDGQPLDGGIATSVDTATGRLQVSVGRGVLGANGGCVGMDFTFPIKGAPRNVHLVVRRVGTLDQAIVASPVLDGQTPTGQWRAHIDCISPASLLVEYDLPNPQGGADDHIGPVPVGGITLIDPQGVVYDRQSYDTALAAKGVTDATASASQKNEARAKAAVEGAKVTLQRLVNGSWKTVNPDDPGISPNVNPQVTGADGLYKWDVSAGSYRVVVSRPGYDTVTSDAAVIPPPKLDLHVPLERNAAPVATFSVAGSPIAGEPVTLTSSSSVLNGVLAAQEWDLDDDGQFDDRSGASVTWTFPSAGQRRVRLRVRDADGEVDVVTKTLTVLSRTSTDGGGGGGAGPAAGAATNQAPRDTTPPRVTLKVGRATITKAFSKGVPLTLTCSEASSATITITVDKKTAKRLRLGKTTQVARTSRTCAPGKAVALTLKLSRKARSAARRLSALKLSLSVVALDAAGNQKVTSTPVTLRR